MGDVRSIRRKFYASASWKVLRRRKLESAPYCERCGIVVATSVHHLVPVQDCKSKRLDWDNLQSVCEQCHASYNVVAGERHRGVVLCEVCGMRKRREGEECRQCQG